MRLWTIHPKYLDKQGLTALWREGLLAQKVLEDKTKGYRNHPQLNRFKETSTPLDYLRVYLHSVADEAASREYSFDREKIGRIWGPLPQLEPMIVEKSQLEFEMNHLESKLQSRSPEKLNEINRLEVIDPHPLFTAVNDKEEK